MERQQASSRWRGWAILMLSCVLVVAAILLAVRQLGLTDGSKRAHDLLVIDTALGATLEPVEGDRDAMVVTSIAAGGPADSAGIKVGDVVEEIDGKAAGSRDEVAALLRASPATLIVNRNGKRASLRIPLRSAALPG